FWLLASRPAQRLADRLLQGCNVGVIAILIMRTDGPNGSEAHRVLLHYVERIDPKIDGDQLLELRRGWCPFSIQRTLGHRHALQPTPRAWPPASFGDELVDQADSKARGMQGVFGLERDSHATIDHAAPGTDDGEYQSDQRPRGPAHLNHSPQQGKRR